MSVYIPIRRITSWLLLLASLFVSSVFAAEQSLSHLLEQAQAGDAQAQYKLAESYYRGEGTARNYNEALKWYRQSAEQGYADAQYQLGYLHQHGPDLVKKDDSIAFEWYLKAAEQGHISAQTKVSLMYRMGKGVEKNPEQARKWSMEVLRSKGLLEEKKAPVKSVSKATSQPKSSPKKTAKSANAGKATKSQAKRTMSEAERKAWRREQARKLVEKMNREAAAAAWSDVDE